MKLLFLVLLVITIQSCNYSEFSSKTKEYDLLSVFNILAPAGRNPEIVAPDVANTGPACGCGIKKTTNPFLSFGASMSVYGNGGDYNGNDKSMTSIKNNLNHNEAIAAYREGEVLVKFKTNARERIAITAIRFRSGKVLQSELIGASSSLRKLTISPDLSVKEAVSEFSKDPDIEYAQPNYLYHNTAIPNDYEFNNQWGLRNSGQTVNAISGTFGFDINASAAWDVRTDCSNIIIAVIDTGINYLHGDLSDNMWDGISCVNESGSYLGGCMHGYDFIDHDKDPRDMNGHGTHVAGIIGASGNDGNRTSGVCWKSNIMALRALDMNGNGATSDLVGAIEFAIQNGARIINASWGGSEYDPALYNAIQYARDHGVLFVAASGNQGMNNDEVAHPNYPSSFDLDNIISVASINQNGYLDSFSSYGPTSVDIAAPGSNVLSLFPAEKIDAIEYFSSWKREAGWGFNVVNVALSSYGYTGAAGELLNPVADGDLYSNDMDSCTYRAFDFVKYGPDMVTLFFAYNFYQLENGSDNVFLVYDTEGNRPVTDLGVLDANTQTYSYDLTSIATDHTTIGFRFVTNHTVPGYGINISPFVISRWYYYSNATACEYFSGTSMATPHVTGVAGLVLAADPVLTYLQAKNKLLNGGIYNSYLDGKISGGRMLDALGALGATP